MGCSLSLPEPPAGDTQLRIQNVHTSGSLRRLCLEGKIVLLGDSGVGKSSLALRFCRGRFPLYHEVTIGAAFLQQTVRLDSSGNQIKLYIWDTGGQERFRAMAPLYYRDAAGAVVVYDATAPSSLEAVKFWTKELRKQLNRCSIIVAANKIDLLSQCSGGEGKAEGEMPEAATTVEGDAAEQQTELAEARRGIEQIENFCKANNFPLVECSAKSGLNVSRLFEELAREVFVSLKDSAASQF